ncbi:MAG: protein kinase [Sandaracinaceae bacterium]|jgi:tetratricopeptide (TPR) repeat protein|nr:protein kinase [Sandaracinaceae bacterium]
MNPTTDILRGELERLFELEDMKRLSCDLLGLDPEEVGGTAGKGAFSRALVERCVREDSLEALADALLFTSKGVDDRVRKVFEGVSEDIAPGTVIEGMRVIKKLGEGGLGVVYLAERKTENAATQIALKVIRREFARDRAAVNRYLTVSRVLARVKCKALAQIHGVGQLPDGRPWVATQYLEGQALGTRLARVGPMHFNEAKPVLRSVLEGLEALHAKGLVHGDVKAENVFVVRGAGEKAEATAVLVDGGTDRLLARGSTSVDRTGIMPLFGTAKSIAPEQARGGQLDARSDVYAVGTLMYETLVGKPPFVGASAIDIVLQHIGTEPQEPSKVAPRGWVQKELDTVVLRALAKDPAARYQTASELREAIESVGRSSVRPPSAADSALDEKAFAKAADALRADPTNEENAIALEQIVDPSNSWDQAVTALSEAAAAVSDAEAKKALYFRIARIQEHELKSATAAEEAYKQILAVDANDEIAQIGIEELRRASGNNEGLVEWLLEKVEKTDLPADRAEILAEIATIYDEMQQPDSAFIAWVQAFTENPSDERTIREIERLAGTNGERWNEALTTISEAAQHTTERIARTNLYVQMGSWYGDKVLRPDFALSCFQQALTIDPSNDEALNGTVALYRKAQAWPDLVNILLRRADTSSHPGKARDSRAEAAEIIATRLNDQSRAIEIFNQVLQDDPVHGRATSSLEDIYSRANKWPELVKLLDGKSHNQRGQDKVETLAHMAEIYEDRLTDTDQAAVHYEAALAIDARHLPSLKGIELIYAKTGKFPELLTNLRVQIELAATPRQKIALLERIGGIQEEEFVDHAKASETFEEIVAIDPAHEAANTALARLYRQLHRFDELALTLDRHSKGTADHARKLELLLTAVKVLTADVGAPDRALIMCERVLAIDPKHNEALETMAHLKAQTGDTMAALAAVEKLAEGQTDIGKKAEQYVRAGKILEEKGDNDRAIEKYKQALDIDKNSISAATALRSIFGNRGDAHGAAELLARQVDMTEGAGAKSKLLAELGTLYRERLHENGKAKEAFTKALELDPTSTPAGRGLGEMAFEDENWTGAVRYLEPLLARTAEMLPQQARDVALQCGDALRTIGQADKAQRAYINARAFAPNDREVLERVAEVTFEGGAADEAVELYRAILKQFNKELVGSDRGRILYHIGEASRRANDMPTAILNLKEAAEHMPGDALPLDALAKAYETQGKWEDVVRTLARRMESAADEERFQLLVRTGDIQTEKLKSKQNAVKSYVAALEIRADDRNLLTKLMGVYSENKDWGRLVEVILRIAELVSDPAQLGKYFMTAAAISHVELRRADEAADYYAQALEHDKSLTKAFDGLIACLSEREDWTRLEDAYRSQLRRIDPTATAEQKADLWDSLAEILHHRVSSIPGAVEAYEEAQKLDPSNRRRAELLAEIYATDPKRYYQSAVKVHAELLDKSPYRAESYQALRRLYTDMKKPDESWCVCQALHCLKMAEPDEESFFKKHRQRQPASAANRFNEEIWQKLVAHHEQDALLTAIFTTIVPAVVGTRSQPLTSFGVQPNQKRDAASDPAAMAQMLNYAAGVTDLALPDVFYREGDAGGLSFMFAEKPSIGLGKAALAGGPAQALAFIAGRHLSYFRGGHYLRHLVPTGSGLRAWLLASIKTANPQFPIPADMAANVEEHLAAFKKHMSPQQIEGLKSHVHKLLAAAPELNLKRWVAAVDMTADRVGFILSNDLEIASAVVKASPEDAAAISQKDRLKELQVFSVSEAYLELRHRLGINIGE